MATKFSLSQHGTATVLAVDGRLTLDGGSSTEFRNLVEKEFREGHVRIVVDLSNCTSADSSGIAVLTSAFTKSSNLGGKIVIAKPQQRLREILHMTKLEIILPPYDSVEAALSAVQGNAE